MMSLHDIFIELPKKIPIDPRQIEGTHLLMVLTTICAVVLSNIYRKNKIRTARNELLRKRLEAYTPEPLAPSDDYVEPLVPTTVNDTYDEGSPKAFPTVTNLIGFNFLNLFENQELRDMAAECIRCNGVGTCGPRGFFGTLDIHVELEKRIATFLGLEEAVLYAYSISTMSSVLIAYCKKGDVIFYDECVTEPSIDGLKASKATMIPFKHNDPEDFRAKLDKFNKIKKNDTKVFILLEGIYVNTGKICQLPEFLQLCQENRIRIILDESISLGTLGKTGKGLTEHHDIDPREIDFIVGSLEHGLVSVGGFCASSSYIIEHQRLSGLGYCFSASQPSLLCCVAKHAIDSFEETPQIFVDLRRVSCELQDRIGKLKGFEVISDRVSPRKVFICRNVKSEAIIEKCKVKGLLIDGQDDKMVINVQKNLDEDTMSKICSILQWASM